MPKYDLVLKGATVLVPHPSGQGLKQERLDVGIQNGRTAALSGSLHGDQEINLSGLHLLPGVIDSQVHFREPGLTHKEDLESGTRGALLGGVTAVFEMPNTSPSTTTKEAFNEKISRAQKSCHTHYAFYMGASAENAANLADLESLPGCSGVKIFMGSSTGSLLVDQDDQLEKILRSGKRRIAVHAEDENRLKERKHLAVTGAHPRFHPVWRDEETAFLATRRIAALAEKTSRPIHVLHVTTAEEMAFLKTKKPLLSVEVLPQHLTFSAPEIYDRLGTLVQMNPPIRDRHHQEALWRAVLDGTVDVMGSDHAPHTMEEKKLPYPQSPSGFPGVQTLVPIMLNHVHHGRISLERFVELVSEGPRRLFKLKDHGRIALGSWADFTVVDLKKQKRIEASWIASKCGWSPYVDMQVTGWPMMTVLRGKIAMQEGEVLLPPSGQALSFETA